MIKMNEEYIKEYEDMSLYDFADELVEPFLTVKQDLTKTIYIHYAKERDEKEQLQNNWNELKKLIDERIGDCRYFLANADVNYEKENMKKFMWLKEELQVLKSKAQELEQGKDG